MNPNSPVTIIRSLGISATHLGYYYLNTAILLVLEDENRLLMISKLLYPLVAELHSTTPTCIERNIRTVISLCWNRGDRERLFQIAGCRIQVKPTNGEFIDILSCYVKKQCPFDIWKKNGQLREMLIIPDNLERRHRLPDPR